MCGIVGYVGFRSVLPVVLGGLKKLEYRGYDSAGIVILGKDLSIIKKQGKIARLEKELEGTALSGEVGIGHTRWATHGAPTDENAHPHLDCKGSLAVVHNGIIENYLEIKTDLIEKGHHFISDTDSEVIAHLIEENLTSSHDLFQAILASVPRLAGSFALAVAHRESPGTIVCVRRESPLVLGLGEGENFLASDITALLPYTKKIIVMDNNEVARIEKHRAELFNIEGATISRQPIVIDWDLHMAEKGGFEHYMLKEIHEQPQVLKETLQGRLNWEKGVLLEEAPPREFIRSLEHIYITACGTAYHAGICGKQFIEELVKLPVEVDIASEMRYRPIPLLPKSLAVVISQSGETADTLAALHRFKRQRVPVLAITNVRGSSVSRDADWVLYTKAGPEIAVASTKAYVTQLLSFILLSTFLAQNRESSSILELRRITTELQKIPLLAEQVLEMEKRIQDYAHRLRYLNDYFVLGRGLDYATAMEGALKLKEISYVHCEAYAAGELKHGPLALITLGKQVCLLATQDHLLMKSASNLKEVKARGGQVLAITQAGIGNAIQADEKWELPPTNHLISPILAIIPLQLFAYYMAKEKGCDIDQPRNLAKSVTVE